jgi:putative transposase
MRNLLAVAKTQHRAVISALIRTIFAQPDQQAAIAQLRSVVDQLEGIAPPGRPTAPGHGNRPARLRIVPTRSLVQDLVHNPIERLNRELKRRTDVVQIFPNTESVIRLVGALLDDDTQLTSLPAAPRN